MDKLFLRVYQMNHPDGTPRKYWCCGTFRGDFVSRWAAHGAKLQENIKPASATTAKAPGKKEGEGYVFVGEFMVSDQIHWKETSPTQSATTTPQAAVQPVAAKSKFDDALVHWSAKRLPEGWQQQVDSALADVIVGDDIVVSQYDDVVEIAVFHKTIKLKGKQSAGSLTLGDGDWMASLILLSLAKFLPVSMVDDASNSIDRRFLKSMFVGKGHLFSAQDSSLDEFDDFATKLGLMPKMSASVQQATAQFF